MAATVSILGTATFTTTSGTKTVTATPAVGDLIVIVTAHSGNTSTAAPTDNNSGGAGTYTLINTAVKATSADTMKMWVRNALITSGTSTVFTHAPGTSTGGGLVVLDIQGMDKAGASAFLRSAIQSNQAAGGTPAPVFGATPSSLNPIIGAVFNASSPAGLTPRTNYSEIFDNGYNTPTTGLEVMARNSGETSATITWGSTSATAYASMVAEFDSRVTHATTGTLTGQLGSVAGSAAHQSLHTTTGVLDGQTATITGDADHEAAPVPHTTTGDLTGPGSTIAGASTRFRAFSTSGALPGGTATITGDADHEPFVLPHESTGALTGPGSTVSGTATHQYLHTTTGSLTGAGSQANGAAARFRAFSTSGALSGAGAIIVGDADHEPQMLGHVASGALVGPGSLLEGYADREEGPNQPELQRGESWMPQMSRKRKWSEDRDEREALRKAIEQAIDPITEPEAKVVTVKGEVAVVTESRAIALPVPPQFDAQAVARMAVSVLEKAGIEAQRVRDAENRRRALLAFEAEKAENVRRLRKRRRDEEIMLLM